MSYTFSTTLDRDFDTAVAVVIDALKQEGFGVLTEIDVRATLKAKIGAEVPAYRILGACNPKMAHQALQHEPDIGVMLPCNVVVREDAEGRVHVSAVDPVASMQAVENADLGAVASQVRDALKRVIDGLDTRSAA